MSHCYQRPNPSLATQVRTMLIQDGATLPGPDQLPIFLNGMPALFCRFHDKGTEHASRIQLTLYGRSIPGDMEFPGPKTSLIIYFFNPFVIAALFRQPIHRLVKSPLELDNWNGQTTVALKTQLLYAKTTAEKISVLDNFLLHLAEENKKELYLVQYATDRIMCEPGTEVLSDIVKHLAITERSFQRIFKKYVGTTPVQYRRICQFQLSFTQLKSGKFEKLTDIAYDNGFADQSHFNRSFREFTAITPNEYLRSGLKKKT